MCQLTKGYNSNSPKVDTSGPRTLLELKEDIAGDV